MSFDQLSPCPENFVVINVFKYFLWEFYLSKGFSHLEERLFVLSVEIALKSFLTELQTR